jgi:hypothetical protein
MRTFKTELKNVGNVVSYCTVRAKTFAAWSLAGEADVPKKPVSSSGAGWKVDALDLSLDDGEDDDVADGLSEEM